MVPESAVCIYPEEVSSSRQPLKISDDFLQSHTQHSFQFVNFQEALSEHLGENGVFPQDTEP